jgi:hypothetical protein
MGVTALGVFLSYLEVETANGFYPVQMEDWQKHYGVAFALRETGIPPTSPFFYGLFPEEKLIYYYFLHLNAATLDLLQGSGPALHYAFVTIILLASLAFSGLFFILARTLFDNQKAAVWGLGFATVIGGLDVIPIVERAIREYRRHFPEGPLPAGVFLPGQHIDNWVSALSLRLNTFYAHHVWVPQHLTGLTIICLGCYFYLTVEDRRKLLVIYPLLLFALLGHSAWIAAVVGVCLFLFALAQIWAAYRGPGVPAAGRLLGAYALIILLTVAVSAPFILSLAGPQAPKSGIVFEVPTLDSWWLLRPFQATFGPALWARLLDLPLHFLLELGALGVAGLAGLIVYFYFPAPSGDGGPGGEGLLRRELCTFWLLLLAVGVATVSCLASGRGWQAELNLIQNNDLGLRALMPGQLVLALFAGYLMSRLAALAWPRPAVVALGLLIGLGVASSAWEFTAMGLAKYWHKPQLTLDVYRTLRDLPTVTFSRDEFLPVVQHRLHRDASRFQLSLGGRPVAFSTGEAIVFHRHVNELALAHELSQQAFDNGLPVWSFQMFRHLGADYIFVGPAERHPDTYHHSTYFERVYLRGDFAIYEVKPPAYGQAQANFDAGTIIFEGYFIDPEPRYPAGLQAAVAGDTRGLVTAWRLTRPADKNYTLFVHLVDEQGRIIGQADHQLWAWDVRTEGPTTTWTDEMTHLDIAPIPAAAFDVTPPLTLRLGLWLPDTGQSFPAGESTLPLDEAGRLVAGELTAR